MCHLLAISLCAADVLTGSVSVLLRVLISAIVVRSLFHLAAYSWLVVLSTFTCASVGGVASQLAVAMSVSHCS
jgi:hypothetical protein